MPQTTEVRKVEGKAGLQGVPRGVSKQIRSLLSTSAKAAGDSGDKAADGAVTCLPLRTDNLMAYQMSCVYIRYSTQILLVLLFLFTFSHDSNRALSKLMPSSATPP